MFSSSLFGRHQQKHVHVSHPHIHLSSSAQLAFCASSPDISQESRAPRRLYYIHAPRAHTIVIFYNCHIHAAGQRRRTRGRREAKRPANIIGCKIFQTPSAELGKEEWLAGTRSLIPSSVFILKALKIFGYL